MAAKQRIAFVANTSWSIYKFRLYLIERLLKQGFTVFVLAPRDAYTASFEDLNGLAYFELNHLRGKIISPFQDLLLYRELKSHYRTLRPHLIFHYTIKATLFGSLAASHAGIPSVAVITGLGYTLAKKGWLSSITKLLYRNILPHASETWFLNDDDRDFFIGEKLIAPGKTFLLPGEGVDPDQFAPASIPRGTNVRLETDGSRVTDKPGTTDGSGEITFLLIGRLILHKGIREYVQAAGLLRQQGLHVRCQLLGFFDENNPVAIPRQKVETWNKEDIVSYLGHTDNVAPFIARAHCIVLPSYREGMPLSLLEGASMGKALIATDTAGCRAVIRDGVNGFLCRVKDGADLAAKMAAYYRLSPAAKEQMGSEGRKLVLQKFTRNSIVDLYLGKIDKLTKP